MESVLDQPVLVLNRPDLDLDHVLLWDRRGQTNRENIVCSCISSKTRKDNRLPHNAQMHLILKPKHPKRRSFVHITFTANHHDRWKHFLDLAY